MRSVRRQTGRAGLLALACLAVVLAACSSKGPRYPEDFARYQRIDAAVESLRKAYAGKDLLGLHAMMLPLERLERMEAEITRDFEQFQEISLDFSIDRIVIDGETIEVFLHWQGQWKRTPADTGIRERGHGVLRWVGVKSILLSNVDGDLPFGMAIRHTEPQKGGSPG
jgi:hypothetical protein